MKKPSGFYVVLGLFFLFFIKANALTIETAQIFDDANKSFLEARFEEAKKQYQEFIKLAKSQNPDNNDKKLINNAYESLQECDFLITHKNLIDLLKKGISLENTNIKEARNTYFKAKEWLKEHQITEIIYANQLIQGILEEYLIKEKKESLENFSATYLEQIKADKKRKKTMVFLGFKKDKKIEYDIETLVVQNLTNIIQSSKSFFISSASLKGTLPQQLNLAKESKIDFAVTGSYEKAKGKSVLLNFIVFDTYNNRQLVDVSVTTPLNTVFFKNIEKVAKDLSTSLKNYSRFEDFDCICYTQEEGKELVKTILPTEEKGKKDNLPLAVDNKIFQLEKAYIAWILENTQGVLPAFNLALKEINHFNQRHFDLKIEQEEFLSNKRHEIVQAFVKETKFNTLKENLSLQKEQQNYKKYFSLYQEAKDLLKKGKKDYQSLAPFFYEDLEIPLDNDKTQVEESLALIEKLSVVKYGVGLGGHISQGKIFSWEGGDDSPFGNKTNKNLGFFAQLLWDYRLEKNLWFYAGLGFGHKKYSVNYEEPGNSKEISLKQNFILIDMGIKADLWQNLQLTYGIATYFYFKSNNPLFSLNSGPPFFSVGLEYSFINSTWLNLSLALNYLYPWDAREVKSDNANFLEMKEHSFKAALNFYYQSHDYYLSDASPPWDIYLGVSYTHFSFNTKKDKTGDFLFSKTVPGILVGVQLNSYLFLAFNTALFFASQGAPDNLEYGENYRYHAKGIIQSFNCEVIFASFYQFNLYLTGSIGYVYFYDKNYERYEEVGQGNKDWIYYSRIPSAVFLVNPIGFGLNYDFNSKIRFKFFMHAPSFEEWGKLFLWNAGGKLEIKF